MRYYCRKFEICLPHKYLRKQLSFFNKSINPVTFGAYNLRECLWTLIRKCTATKERTPGRLRVIQT